MEKVLKNRFKTLRRKFGGTISRKIRLKNFVKKDGKIRRPFGGQIGWKSLIRKLVEKLCEKLCGKMCGTIGWKN